MRNKVLLVLSLLVCLFLAAGCAHFVQESEDPVTGDKIRVLTEDGEKVKDALVTAGQAAGAPFGLPPHIWEWGAAGVLGILGVSGAKKGIKKLKNSEKGKIV